MPKKIFDIYQKTQCKAKQRLVQIFRQRIPQIQNKTDLVQKINYYAQQLSRPIVSFKNIQQLAWYGIPDCIRPKIWKYLLKYCFLNDAGNILSKKRQEYKKFIKNYWKIQNLTEEEKNIHRTIQGDVKRIGLNYNQICKQELIQIILKRILLIWHMRHPQTGYVQGMCDIAIPFVIVFLTEYLPLSTQQKYAKNIKNISIEDLQQVQADSYWCMSKMIQKVLSNYTHGLEGLQQACKVVQKKLEQIDLQLFNHFKKQKIDLFAFSFRNLSTMLMRMFNPRVAFRLLDTYISFQDDYHELMIYLLIAVLEKFAKKMLKMKFQETMALIQKLPAQNWTEQQIQIIIAEAYVYMTYYKNKN